MKYNEKGSTMKKEKDNYQGACIDFETNGLTPDDDSLSMSVRLLNPDGAPTDVEFYSLIHTDQELDPAALFLNNLTEEEIRKAPPASQVVDNFKLWYQKYCKTLLSPIGHNFISFDEPRLEDLFTGEYGNYFHYHSDDTMIIARALRRAGFLKVDSCSLDTLSDYLKIENPNPHHASGDTWTTGMIYSILLKILSPNLLTRFVRVFNPNYLGISFKKINNFHVKTTL